MTQEIRAAAQGGGARGGRRGPPPHAPRESDPPSSPAGASPPRRLLGGVGRPPPAATGWRHVWPPLALAAVVAAFFAPALFGPYHIPRGGGDLASFLFPMYRFLAAALGDGQIPLWNPHQYAGAPVAGDNQSGLLYPPNFFLFAAWPRFPYSALEAMVAVHVWWAGAGVYALVRGWRRDRPIGRPAAVLAGIAWMLSDGFVTHVGNYNYVAAAAWLPWGMLSFRRSSDATTTAAEARWAIATGLAVGIGILAGHAQVSFFTLLAIGAFALWSSLAERCPRPLWRAFAAGVVALGLAAPMILPMLELRPHTVRAAYDYATSLEYSLPPEALVGLLVPGAIGRGIDAFAGWWPRVEVGYAGVLPWLLAVVALSPPLRSLRKPSPPLGAAAASPKEPPGGGAPPGDDRSRRGADWMRGSGLARSRLEVRDSAFFVGLGLLSLLLALGPATPLHRLILGPLELPFRAPARFVLLTDLALAVLAAAGLDRLLRSRPSRRSSRELLPATVLAAVAVIAVVALWPFSAVFGPLALEPAARASWQPAGIGAVLDDGYFRSLALACAAFVALVAASLGLVHAHASGRLGRRWLAVLAPALLAVDLVGSGAGTELERDDPSDGFRVTEAATWLRQRAGHQRIDTASGSWQPGAAQVHGLYDIGGVYNPMRLGVYAYAMDGLQRRGSPLYDLFGVRYIVTAKGEPPADDPNIGLAHEGDPRLDIWANDGARERAIVVPAAGLIVAPDDSAAFELVRAQGFDPRRQIVLTAADAAAIDHPVVTGTLIGATAAEIVDYTPNAVGIEVRSTQPAWLLLTDVYAPGWRARVDGAPAPVVRANFAFRAVALPAGARRVDMRYVPPGWAAGWLAAFATLLATGAAWAVTGRGRTRGQPV